MAFWNLGTLELEEFRPGILSRVESGKNLIMACMEIGPGKKDTGHMHPFDQCGIIIEGQIEIFIDGDSRLLGSNESYFIPSGRQHGWKTFGRPVKILDISSVQPQK